MGLLDAYKKATNNWDAKDGKLNEERWSASFKLYECKTLLMTINVTPNKKDPDNPYRNYEFSAGKKIEKPQPGDDATGTTTEVDDDDLPF